MDTRRHSLGEAAVYELLAAPEAVTQPADLLETALLPELADAAGFILAREALHPSFFDLRSGVAGELLQKCATYRIRLALVGDFSDLSSEPFRALMRESLRGRQVGFVDSVESALAWLRT